MKKLLFLCLLGLSTLSQSEELLFDGQPLIRVRVMSTLDTLHITTETGWKLFQDHLGATTQLENTSFMISKEQGQLIVFDSSSVFADSTQEVYLESTSPSSTLMIKNVPYGVGWWWGGQEDRVYEGLLHIYIDSSDALCVTIHLPLEEYLKGVVPYEIGGDSPLEALKAQAVAARSEAVIALTSKLYSGEHHDLTSDVECQVFSGNHKRTALADQAVDDTRTLTISEEGVPINAYYASNCGGHAEIIENVWPGRPRPLSYQIAATDNQEKSPVKLTGNWRFQRWLKSSPQVNCNPEFEPSLPTWSQKNFRWSRTFTHTEITEMLSDNPSLGAFKRIKVLERGVSGRIIRARLIFENGYRIVVGELALRQLFEPSLRSSAFVVKKIRSGFVVNGAGWGHGVGMCQSGARAMADRGASFEEILLHYYPRASLLQTY